MINKITKPILLIIFASLFIGCNEKNETVVDIPKKNETVVEVKKDLILTPKVVNEIIKKDL